MGNSKGCSVGFDLGGTKMRAVVADEKFQIMARAKERTDATVKPSEGLDRMAACIDTALDKAGVKPKDLEGIGFALPGLLDIEAGVIKELTNIQWSNVPIAEEFTKRYGCPVVIENDVNAGTYGEFRFGAGKGRRDIVGVFPGTGIGGGIIIDGRLHRGATGLAGEIGHMIFDPEGNLCGCGTRGCFEAHASRPAIAAEAAKAAARGQAPALLKKGGSDLSSIRSGALAKAIAGGDETVEAIVRRGAYLTGLMAVNLIVVLAPEMVVLGGGLVEAMEDLYLEECRRAVATHRLKLTTDPVEIVAASLGDDAVNLGAAALATERAARK